MIRGIAILILAVMFHASLPAAAVVVLAVIGVSMLFG